MAIDIDAFAKVASAEALRFIESLRGGKLTAADRRQLELFAAQELALAEVAARSVMLSIGERVLKAMEKAVATGEIAEEFTPDRIGKLITTGLKDYDPGIAFQAGVRSAYNAGRYERTMAADSIEYFIYRTIGDGRVRASHAKLNGVALPKTDPFWDTHYPPNGWRCRCLAYGVNEAGLAKLRAAGVDVQTIAPDEEIIERIDPATGEKTKIPASIEPGWDYNPAKRPDLLRERLAARLSRLDSE